MVGQKVLDGVLEMLRESPGRPVSEVAAGTGLSRSTTGKALAELERQKRARRVLPASPTQPGPLKSTLWFLPADTIAPLAPEQDTAELENTTNAADDDSQAATATAPTVSTPCNKRPDSAQATRPTPDENNRAATPDDANEDGPRLRKGELRALVLERLNAEPDAEFSPTTLSKQLGRSSGAITNALVRLCLDGQAVETNTRPRRYGAAPPKAA